MNHPNCPAVKLELEHCLCNVERIGADGKLRFAKTICCACGYDTSQPS